jgi:site-specific DNA recombinase
MKRAALYARFSSDKQNERSCRDQLDLCRSWAEKRGGIIIVAEYADEAVSGASTINRLGLGRMMRDARDGAFDLVICEALDRLSRDQADLATIKKQLTFLEIGISTVQDGDVGAMHIGLKGLMGEMFLADLAQKTRRGQRARVATGASGGGRSYGYDPVPGRPGEMTINAEEAEIVRRIFREYADGRTPREIVAGLNREHIPGPRRGAWNASTINGSRQRGNGILRNRLYVGEIVWNRQRFVKDPATGKRVSRLNPEADWLVAPAPQLAIVERGLWDAAQRRQGTFSPHRPTDSRRPKHLLSGLLRCACCGGGYTIINRDRLGCSAVRERGTCTNHTMVARVEAERRVLSGLQKILADEALVAEYVREYHRERLRLADEARSSQAERRSKLESLLRSIDRGIAAILAGDAPEGLARKLREMELEADRMKQELAFDEPSPAALYPQAAAQYVRLADDIQRHLAGMAQGPAAIEVTERVRALIERVEIGPRNDQGPATIEVYGALVEIPGRGSVVAGTRNNRFPTFKYAA